MSWNKSNNYNNMHGATINKYPIYIKKQQDCLFEQTKSNFCTAQVLHQQQNYIKNVKQSDTCA